MKVGDYVRNKYGVIAKSTDIITPEMIEGYIKDFKVLEDTPLVYNDTLLGNIDGLTGGLEMSFEGESIIKELLKETATEIYVEDSLGNKYKGTYRNEITNIHRVRKGKRYIIKFDYTGLIYFDGVKVGD